MLGDRKPCLELFDTQIHDIIELMRKGIKKCFIVKQFNLTNYQWKRLKEIERATL